MLEIANVRLPLDAGLPGEEAETTVRHAAAKALGVQSSDVASVLLLKRSVDARKKSDVHFVATLGVELADGVPAEDEILRACGVLGKAAGERSANAAGADKGAGCVRGGRSRHGGRPAHPAARHNVKRRGPYCPLPIPDCADRAAQPGFVRPVVVGMGPAGLFAAVYLARAGLRPVVLERGASVEERAQDVAAFQGQGVLDPDSNVQFGEGGAGTFSDGKLTTNTKNPYTKHVLRWFADAGAPDEILWQAHPHIGSDRLPGVVAAMRSEVIERGGEVRFHARLCDLAIEGGRVVGVTVEDVLTGGREKLPAAQVVLACGHSARDVFELLRAGGFSLEPKPFSVGVRIEHPQQLVNIAQWGKASAHPALGAAEYKLAVHLPNGRGVYTFCMCPGGEVVCAASEEGGVVVNGMSNFARDGANANSALLVGVDPEDFEGEGPLAGVEFQRRIERAAYRAALGAALDAGVPERDAVYRAPSQTVGDFLEESAAGEGVRAAHGQHAGSGGAVAPTYARGVVRCSLRDVLPGFVADALAEALPLLDRKLKGFADPQAVMTGVETRSSSPVRIVRGEDRQAWLPATLAMPNAEAGVVPESPDGPCVPSGVFPCGEGAGYAGGIMSAAVDGLRSAEALVRAL